MKIVWSELIIPAQFSGLGLQREHTVGIEVDTCAFVAVRCRKWIAHCPVERSGLDIIGSCRPGCTATGFDCLAGPCFRNRLPRLRDRPKSPGKFARRNLICSQEAAQRTIAAGDS